KFLLLHRDDWEVGGVTDNKHGTIYYSTHNGKQWSPIKKLGNNINSTAWESHACISPNGKRIYFTSDRKGGLGGLDIYYSEKNSKGVWGPAINLGPTINTYYDESTPFILPDGKTLFFSSEGHYNMGGFDIFYSKLLDNGVWTDPINLGYPINSTADNEFFVPTNNGYGGYYAVARHEGYFTFGNVDIYKLNILLPEKNSDLNPVEITFSGNFMFEDLNEHDTSAKVIITNADTKKIVAIVKPDSENLHFEITLPPANYILDFHAENYKPTQKTAFLKDVKRKTDISYTINLQRNEIDNKKYYTIKNIYFDFNSRTLNRDAIIEIEKLYVIMNENPELYVEVIGHTDSKGSDEYNLQLSIDRSKAVTDYLMKKGIEKTRFVTKGMGKQNLITNDINNDGIFNDETARYNRRVEIRILRANENVEITVEETIPDYIRLAEFNRFSIVVTESIEKLSNETFLPLKSDSINILYMQTEKGYVYFFGDYRSKQDAIRPLGLAIEKGFTSARIIDYFELNKMNSFVIVHKVDFKPTYTIQLKAVDRRILLDAYIELKEVKEKKTKDGFYRYTYKTYSSEAQAQADLKYVIDKGFVDAFIIETDKIRD
ncbi:MAG: OmpA family protein, partial [Bacteroidales bacterium]